MRQYELMVVFAPTVDATDAKTIGDGVKKLLGERATVTDVKLLGKKTLAYPIRKLTEGVYALATISADGLQIGDIEKRARVGSDVLRYLLTVKEA